MAIPGHARHQCHSHINCAVLPVNQHPLPGSSKCADSSHYPAKLKWICQILDDILCGRPNRHIGPLHWISPILLYPTAARSLHVRDCTELLLTSCICFRLLCQSIGSFSWKQRILLAERSGNAMWYDFIHALRVGCGVSSRSFPCRLCRNIINWFRLRLHSPPVYEQASVERKTCPRKDLYTINHGKKVWPV